MFSNKGNVSPNVGRIFGGQSWRNLHFTINLKNSDFLSDFNFLTASVFIFEYEIKRGVVLLWKSSGLH